MFLSQRFCSSKKNCEDKFYRIVTNSQLLPHEQIAKQHLKYYFLGTLVFFLNSVGVICSLCFRPHEHAHGHTHTRHKYGERHVSIGPRISEGTRDLNWKGRYKTLK